MTAKMARKEKYIPGIYSYCDRWCERCPFTARCRTFAMEQKFLAKQKRRDAENAEFWTAIEKAFGESFDPAMKDQDPFADDEEEADSKEKKEQASENGPFLDNRRAGRKRHPLAQAAMDYLYTVQRWFNIHREFREPLKDPSIDSRLADALEVIHYYHMFIHVKICRALNEWDHDEDDDFEDADAEDLEIDPVQNDSNGSAKIAIIAIERSISAWTIAGEHFPQQAKIVKRTITNLARLRHGVDKCFPHARDFHRPGFDD